MCPNCRRTIDEDQFICLGPIHHYFNQTNPCGEIGWVSPGTLVVNGYNSMTMTNYQVTYDWNNGYQPHIMRRIREALFWAERNLSEEEKHRLDDARHALSFY